MFSHADIWNALDQLAKAHSTSPSGLAKLAGLDPTTFNKSKRKTAKGKDRWPSTESLSKVLTVIGMSFEDFASFATYPSRRGPIIPAITLKQASDESCFDETGTPIKSDNWHETHIQDIRSENVYAIEIDNNDLSPILRRGYQILVAPGQALQKGDKIVIKTHDNTVLIKELHRITTDYIDVMSLGTDAREQVLPRTDIMWIGRIIWISQ